MGLGKTAQVISLIAYLMENHELQPLLVVVPLAIIENWVQELKKFLPDLDLIYIHRGPGRLKDHHAIEKYNVTIVGYETLARDQVTFGKIKWSYIICDETQKIKNFNTLASNAVKGMNAEHKIAMTGTPIENNLSELWSIVDFIQPGLLGSHKYFVREYERPLKHAYDAALADELIEKIKPVFIRRTKTDVLSEVLPEKEETTIPVELSELQRDMYIDILNQVHNGEIDNGMKLASIQKLIEVCSLSFER